MRNSCYYNDIAKGSKTRLDNIQQDIITTKYETKSLIDANSNDIKQMMFNASWSRSLTGEAKGICSDSWQKENCFERYKDMVNCASEIHLPLAEYLLIKGFRDKAQLIYDDFLKKYRHDESLCVNITGTLTLW